MFNPVKDSSNLLGVEKFFENEKSVLVPELLFVRFKGRWLLRVAARDSAAFASPSAPRDVRDATNDHTLTRMYPRVRLPRRLNSGRDTGARYSRERPDVLTFDLAAPGQEPVLLG